MSGLQQDFSWEGSVHRVSDFREKRGGDFTLLVNTSTDTICQDQGDKNPYGIKDIHISSREHQTERIRTKAYEAEDRTSDHFSECFGQTKDVKKVSPDCQLTQIIDLGGSEHGNES